MSSSAIAFVFPGQGSQYVGMGRELYERFAVARTVFEESDDALGEAISKMCFEGPAEALQMTENTQPAILATSIAAFRVMQSQGLGQADFVAGHSLGEYSALVAANALSLTEAIKIVRARGRYMQEAVPAGIGAMAAILGVGPETVRRACEEARGEKEVCSPANFNSPGQVVIAGHARAVEQAGTLLKERGAKRVIPLKVSAPFHCELMRSAQDKLAVDLERATFAHLDVPLVSNADVSFIRYGADAKDSLLRQVTSPVRWQETIELLCAAEYGVGEFIEVGPGKVLSGLVRQTNRSVNCSNVEDTVSLEKLAAGKVRRRSEAPIGGVARA
ncbi:MAG: ACP S-malonyltransferase [Pyrinomonadaceae bacterium]